MSSRCGLDVVTITEGFLSVPNSPSYGAVESTGELLKRHSMPRSLMSKALLASTNGEVVAVRRLT